MCSKISSLCLEFLFFSFLSLLNQQHQQCHKIFILVDSNFLLPNQIEFFYPINHIFVLKVNWFTIDSNVKERKFKFESFDMLSNLSPTSFVVFSIDEGIERIEFWWKFLDLIAYFRCHRSIIWIEQRSNEQSTSWCSKAIGSSVVSVPDRAERTTGANTSWIHCFLKRLQSQFTTTATDTQTNGYNRGR